MDRRRFAAAVAPARPRAVQWARWARPLAPAIGIMAVFVGLDMLSTPELVYLPLLSLGPAFAAISASAAQVALIGCLGAALWYPMVDNDGLFGSFQGYVALATIVGATGAAAFASARRQRKERELGDVRAVAEIAEQVLLRRAPSQMGQLQIAARYVSAASSARVGGDVYDIILTGRVLRILVGDVQGKGLPAVRTAAIVLAAFREAAYDAPDLAEIAGRIELSLERQAAEEEFVTVVLAQVGTDGTALEILNCGHPPPMLVRAGAARCHEWPGAALPLGLAELAAMPRKACVLAFAPGDQVLFYTDGISEARDASGEFYPLERRLGLLDGVPPGEGLERLGADVVRHAGGMLRDDAAMLLLRRSPETPERAGTIRAALGHRPT